MKNRKILLVGNTAWSMYNFRLGVAKALRKEKYEVIIVAPYDHTSKLILSEGFQHINIIVDNKGISPKRDSKLLMDLFLLYKRLAPDLIIHYTIKPNIYGGLAAKLAGIKTISFVTGLGSMFIRRTLITRLIEIMYKTSFFFSKKVWFLNEEDYRYFTEKKIAPIRKTEILPGEGINTSEFVLNKTKTEVDKKEDQFRFLYLGRILKDKGVLELVQAFRILKRKYPNAECQLLGFIDALNPSSIPKETIDKWVEEGIVTYLGETSDVKPYLISADCIVLPSYREGISRTLLEAASMQKPIITTNVPGCRDIVENNKTGYLCKIMDYNDLADKMETMLGLKVNERELMGYNARLKVISQFDEQIIINKYIEALSEIL